MKQIITTKNGTTYERKAKEKKYDIMLWTRYNSEKAKKLEEISKKQGVSLSILIRNIIDEYLESEVN